MAEQFDEQVFEWLRGKERPKTQKELTMIEIISKVQKWVDSITGFIYIKNRIY